MIRRPHKVKVGYKTYELRAMTVKEQCLCHGKWGFTNHGEAILLFDEKVDKREVANTVLHEVFHAIRHVSQGPVENEEAIVIAMTDGLCNVMRDNPALFEWILQELK